MTPDDDYLVPDPKVRLEFGISFMTLWRWTKDPTLGFPPQVKINTRNYRSRRELDEFKRRMAAKSAPSPRPPRSRIIHNPVVKLREELEAAEAGLRQQFKATEDSWTRQIEKMLRDLG